MPAAIPTPGAIEYWIVAIYLVVMLGVGVIFQGKNKDVSDYFRSGCKGTWWLVGASAFMAGFSAWTFTGAAGMAYQSGASVLGIYWANALGFLINAAFLAAWFRQLRATTAPEVIRARFNESTQQLFAWLGMLNGVLFAGVFLYGLALFCASVFGFPLRLCVVAVGVVVVLYSVSGGNWAVMATDFLQTMLLIPITVGLAWVALHFAGGVSGLMEQIETQNLARELSLISSSDPSQTASLGWLAAILLQNTIAYNTLNASVRYFAVKDGREARKAAALGAVLFLVGPVFWIIPPIVGRLFFSAQIESSAMPVPAEAAYAIVCLNLLPPGVLGLMIVAVFAATMSSMDTGINRSAAIAIKDVYPAFCRWFGWREASEAAQLVASKVVALSFGGVILSLALYFASQETKGLFDIMIDLLSLVSLPLSIPLVMALFVTRSPSWAGWFSAAAGALPSSWAFFSPQFGAEPWSLAGRVFTIFAFGSVAFLASTACWRFASEDYRQQVNEFFARMRKPVNFELEVGESSDGMQLRLVGGSLAGMGLLIGFLLLAQDSAVGRYFIFGVSLFLMSVGGFMAFAEGKSRR